MVKNRRGVVSIITLSLLVVLCFSIVIFKSSSSKAEKKEIKTGEEQVTIEDYEFDGRSTYIGSGFNAAKKGEIRADQLVTTPIFNVDSTKNANSIRNTTVLTDDNSTSYENKSYQGSTIEKLVKYQSSDFNLKYNITDSKLWNPATGYLLTNYTSNYNKQSISKRVDEYTKDVRTIKTNYITWALDEEDYYSYLTDKFKKDIMTMEPSKLFDKYGTHFLTSVVLGGKLEISSSIKASGKIELEKYVNEMRYYTDMDSLNKAENEVYSKTENENSNKISTDADINITYKSYGGIGTDFRKFFNNVRENILNGKNDGKTLTSDSGYKIWLQSVFRKPTLVDAGDEKSLYPIWKLLEYFPKNDKSISKEMVDNRAEELKTAFNEYGKSEYDKAFIKYNKEMEELEPSKVDTEVTGIKYANFYNKNKKLSDKKAKLHEGYKLGEMIVTNTHKDTNGEYELKGNDFTVEYTVKQDLKNLPVGTSNFKKNYLVADYNPLKSVNGYGKIFDRKGDFYVGKGAYYIQVTYVDQTTDKFSGNNLFKGVSQGDTVKLLSLDSDTLNKHKGVDNIKILTLYETCAYRNPLSQYFFDWVEEAIINFR